MAPSRALLFTAAKHTLRASPSTHLLSTSCRMGIIQPAAHRLLAPRLAALHSGLTSPSLTRSIPAFPCPPRRAYSTPSAPPPEPPDYLNEAELRIFNKVKVELEPVRLEVQDISGGCGTMYALEIESPKFQGLTVFKQHKMVNEVLKEDIKGWHGVQLRTKAA